MASICVHRAPPTPPDSTPGHIRSRDELQEEPRPATELPHTAVRARLVPSQCPVPHFPAIHLARQSPFHGPLGHISSRDGIDLCPSSDPNPSRQHSRAHQLARCFAGRSPNNIELPRKAVRARLVPGPSRSCNSSDTATAILGASKAYRLARWRRFVSIERREPLQTALRGTSARAMISNKLAI